MKKLILLACIVVCAGCRVVNVSPLSAAPGEVVRISGSLDNTQPSNVVEFTAPAPMNTITAVDPQPVPNRSDAVQVTVPNGAVTGPVRVRTPSGTIKSSFDFTVLSTTHAESEPNDTKSQVNMPSAEIPWGSKITGNLEDGGKDWFFLKSGPAAPPNSTIPWGYTLEVLVKNFGDEPLTARLHVRADLMQDVFVPAATGKKPSVVTMWATTLDDTNTFIELVDSGQLFVGPSRYEINIAKVAINDAREPNDTFATAAPLPGAVGERAYLTAAWDAPTDTAIGLVDFYEIPAVDPNETLSVLFLSLDAGHADPVQIQLFDVNQTPVGAPAVSADAAHPLVSIENLVVSASGGVADGVSPWFVRVSTTTDVAATSGKKSQAPGYARSPYGLTVIR